MNIQNLYDVITNQLISRKYNFIREIREIYNPETGYRKSQELYTIEEDCYEYYSFTFRFSIYNGQLCFLEVEIHNTEDEELIYQTTYGKDYVFESIVIEKLIKEVIEEMYDKQKQKLDFMERDWTSIGHWLDKQMDQKQN